MLPTMSLQLQLKEARGIWTSTFSCGRFSSASVVDRGAMLALRCCYAAGSIDRSTLSEPPRSGSNDTAVLDGRTLSTKAAAQT